MSSSTSSLPAIVHERYAMASRNEITPNPITIAVNTRACGTGSVNSPSRPTIGASPGPSPEVRISRLTALPNMTRPRMIRVSVRCRTR